MGKKTSLSEDELIKTERRNFAHQPKGLLPRIPPVSVQPVKHWFYLQFSVVEHERDRARAVTAD